MTPSSNLRVELDKRAYDAGFDIVRVMVPGAFPADAGQHYRRFVDMGHHGDMTWMADTALRRTHPERLWPEVRSIIVLGMNYAPQGDPLDVLKSKNRGAISCYAQGKDYHDVAKKALKRVAGWLHRSHGTEVKVFVDTAPVMEKPVAQQAGLGWQGKHTNLVSREFGSWLFLGSIFTTAELQPDTAETDHCGQCRRCLDVCPTRAFPAPYQLDARRCISYLTIEHKGHIPSEFRVAMGNRVFGCDDCLAVCPWNKFAQTAREQRFAARAETDNPPLADLLALNDDGFRSRFRGTPVRRPGRDRFLRNVLIAAGNSGDVNLIPSVKALLDDPSPLVRAMAVWSLGQLSNAKDFVRLRDQHMPDEADAHVRAEWANIAVPNEPTGFSGMTHLLAIGLGYTARVVAETLKADGSAVTGSARSEEKVVKLRTDGFDMIAFDPVNGVVPDALPEDTTHLLASASPGAGGDPILAHLDELLVTLMNLRWIGYLSTIGVYGDAGGAWIDETADRHPSSERGQRRVAAEDAWMAFGARTGIPVHIFRLPGIYGPGRSPLNKVAAGTARRIIKDGQVFNRAHVEDIAQAVIASMSRPRAGAVYNVADNEPAPPQDVILFAAELLGVDAPPVLDFETADMTPMARSFYGDNKRVRNDLMKDELGVTLKYPTYREGLRQILETMRKDG